MNVFPDLGLGLVLPTSKSSCYVSETNLVGQELPEKITVSIRQIAYGRAPVRWHTTRCQVGITLFGFSSKCICEFSFMVSGPTTIDPMVHTWPRLRAN